MCISKELSGDVGAYREKQCSGDGGGREDGLCSAEESIIERPREKAEYGQEFLEPQTSCRASLAVGQ